MQYVPPHFKLEAFHCPHCNTFAHMLWGKLNPYQDKAGEAYVYQATCAKCELPSVWRAADQSIVAAEHVMGFAKDAVIDEGFMLFPPSSTAPMPSQDLPKSCYQDYTEARDIAGRSPRAAAALLRLIVEKLCHQLGDPSKDINQNIGLLVQRGLPERMQQALDSVRIIGNAAVHPGIMDIEDEPATVATLFKLVNIIVEKLITEPKEIEAVFESLPESRRQGIANRDKSKT